MDARSLAFWRMRNLGLLDPPATDAVATVGGLVAVQSQDFGPAKWSLGDRDGDATDAHLDAAFARGEFLRTHVLRPTWHFVAPDDIRWLLALTGPRVHQFLGYYYRQQGLDEAVLARGDEVLVAALSGGPQLTRKDLVPHLAAAGLPTGNLAVTHLAMHAELEGLICSGAPQGKQQTYALLADRAPDAWVLDADQALAELTLRYFTSHGPATAKDFRWWSSLTLADIRRGLDLVGDRLHSLTADGLTYWFAGSPPEAVPDRPVVHLLQGYDEYIVGYSESKFLLDLAKRGGSRLDRPAANGVLLVDGQFTGHWRRTVTRRDVAFDLEVYAELGPAEHAALQATADRHGRFLGLPARVSVAPR
ncbi:winged helix DNA-binding domain-containing protein [Catellatospora sp. KI3]|uniref:winged helix DNA-binding domain-containing protein n=1 Tax=Catellatospora sp. KI3 TaxID=3041620 RepID=UPI00248216BF|nr:winged helix DNA-binding domain-containing protein [Catellatospora sp. KI3]MDI1463566.1 winged helix DNA-binding domain-containing protein [Catellatospora sp. KI3]